MLKGKAMPLQGLTDRLDFRMFRFPEFLYSWHTKVVRGSNETTRGTIDFRLKRRKSVRMNERT